MSNIRISPRHFWWLLSIVVTACMIICPLTSFSQTAVSSVAQLPNKRINDFQEDKRGFVWIATGRGLCRYDGMSYRNYFSEPGNKWSLPSDFVNSLFLDRHQRLWVSTSAGLCRYDEACDHFVRYGMSHAGDTQMFLGLTEAADGRLFAYGAGGVMVVDDVKQQLEPTQLIRNQIVSAILPDVKNRLYIGCRNSQWLFSVSPDLEHIDSISLGQPTDVSCLQLTDQQLLLVGTDRGIIPVNTQTGGLVSSGSGTIYPHLEYPVTGMTRVDRHLLVSTESNGVLAFDWDTRQFFEDERRQFLNNPSLHATTCYLDSHHNLWLGTFNQGFYIDTKTRSTPDYLFNDIIRDKFVTRICPDAADNLWIGTRYDGLFHYNIHTHTMQHYTTANLPVFKTIGSNFVESMMIDTRQNLWVGIGKHLLKMPVTTDGHIGSPTMYNVNTVIVTMVEAKDGTIWTGSSSDGICLVTPQGELKRLAIPHRRWMNVTNILPLRSGQMLYSSYEEGLFLAQPQTLDITSFSSDTQVLEHTAHAICLYEAPNQQLWIGTYGFGVVCYDMKTRHHQIYTMKEGLPSNDVLAITSDADGFLWMSTSFGIARLDPKKKKILTILESDGPEGLQFHEKAVGHQRNGVILFGGNHGVSYFNPRTVQDPSTRLQIVLKDFQVHNKSQTAADGILTLPLDETERIELRHDQNAFSLEFAAIDYAMAQHITYSCKLKGVDHDWVDLGAHGRLAYTNLSAGTYELSIRSRIGNGEWSPNVRHLTIHVRVAPWLSWPALLCYLILTIILSYIIYRIWHRSRETQQRMKQMEQQRERERELNDTKIRFFSNISHELRTPLSMIYGPVKLLDKQVFSPESHYLTRLVKNNVERLLSLIDQLLDLGKMETDALKLQVKEVRVDQIIQSLVDNYSFFAQEKGIELSVSIPRDITTAVIDEDKLMKVTSNLLSNALKYTPHGGHVVIAAHIEEQLADERFGSGCQGKKNLVVSVTDDGIGIPSDKLSYLFERFHRFDGKDGRTDIAGTGIGLNYTKRLIDLHHGEIVAIPREKGMQFAFSLPANDTAYTPEEHAPGSSDIIASPTNTDSLTESSEGSHASTKTSAHPTTDKRILVVEDNPELAQFVRRLLSPLYSVDVATDGRDGFEIANKIVPDLIVSDVMMPEMDGFEMCRQIKADASLCHIPVVLLTARTLPKDQVAGYTQGADAYLPKPFDPLVLSSLINSLFTNIQRRSQQLMRQLAPQYSSVDESHVASEGTITGPLSIDAVPLSPLNQQFIDQLIAYIEKNLSDANLNVNQMASDLCMGRTVFYKKVKTLTGQTPNDFLQNYRLHRAAQLLDSHLYNVSQVGYMVGFSTPSHFSTCFKRFHGISPRDYLVAQK